MKLSFRFVLPALALTGALAWSAPAHAVACTNDVDCPGTACGDQVCSWASVNHVCVPAGTAAQGQDGWCTVDSDCKCMGVGAKCVSPHCTFTLPDAGPATTGDGGGTTTDGGLHGDDAGTITGDSGAVTTRKDAGDTGDGGTSGGGDSGGCDVGGDGSGAALGFGVVALGLAGIFSRRRRRTA